MHTFMDTHRVSLEVRGLERQVLVPGRKFILLQLPGNYWLWKHRFTWHFYLKEANGQ